MISVGVATEAEMLKWDSLVEHSVNGTIFHRLRFLAYHKDRFYQNERHLVFRKGTEPVALMSLLLDPVSLVAKSPYGGSYGGVVFLVRPNFGLSEGVADALIAWLHQQNITEMTVTQPVNICSAVSQDVFIFCLMKQGFSVINRDVTNYVDLQRDPNVLNIIDGRARNMYRKAERLGLIIKNNSGLDEFWPILVRGFAKHGVLPTHSYDDLDYLVKSFPESITFHVAEHEGVIVAGLCEFVINYKLNSSFYFAQDPMYQNLQGLTLLVVDALRRAHGKFVFYDFGTSTVNMEARESVFKFKESFGAEGGFRESLRWSVS